MIKFYISVLLRILAVMLLALGLYFGINLSSRFLSDRKATSTIDEGMNILDFLNKAEKALLVEQQKKSGIELKSLNIKLKNTKSPAERQKIQTEIDELKNREVKTQDELMSNEQEQETLKNTLNTKQLEIKSLYSLLNAKTEKLAQVSREYKEYKIKSESEIDFWDKYNQYIYRNLKKIYKDSPEKLEILESNFLKRRGNVFTISEINNLREQINQKENQIRKKDTENEENNKELHAKIEQLQNNLNKLEVEYSELAEKNKDLNNRFQSISTESSKNEKIIAELSEKNKQYEYELTRIEEQIKIEGTKDNNQTINNPESSSDDTSDNNETSESNLKSSDRSDDDLSSDRRNKQTDDSLDNSDKQDGTTDFSIKEEIIKIKDSITGSLKKDEEQ